MASKVFIRVHAFPSIAKMTPKNITTIPEYIKSVSSGYGRRVYTKPISISIPNSTVKPTQFCYPNEDAIKLSRNVCLGHKLLAENVMRLSTRSLSSIPSKGKIIEHIANSIF